jgi:hypothetical protein
MLSGGIRTLLVSFCTAGLVLVQTAAAAQRLVAFTKPEARGQPAGVGK